MERTNFYFKKIFFRITIQSKWYPSELKRKIKKETTTLTYDEVTRTHQENAPYIFFCAARWSNKTYTIFFCPTCVCVNFVRLFNSYFFSTYYTQKSGIVKRICSPCENVSGFNVFLLHSSVKSFFRWPFQTLTTHTQTYNGNYKLKISHKLVKLWTIFYFFLWGPGPYQYLIKIVYVIYAFLLI